MGAVAQCLAKLGQKMGAGLEEFLKDVTVIVLIFMTTAVTPVIICPYLIEAERLSSAFHGFVGHVL